MVCPPGQAARPASTLKPSPFPFSRKCRDFPMVHPRKIFWPFALLLALIIHAPTGATAQTRDVAGAKDFPGIGRFGGSVITGYQVKDFDAARMQAAAFKDGNPADARRLEGRITRIAYATKPGPSILEVSRNFETQLAKAGFETLLACDTDACGGIPFTEAIDVLPIPQMWVDGFNYHYYAGRKLEGGRETYASVVVSENNREIHAQLTVAELGAIENKMVDAAAMAKGLGETGHIALYGIYFDTDKAAIKPESRPTLDQIAKLLTSQPQLNVFIVGHTDSQGAYDYNLDLSRRRAEATATELVKSYRIAQARLRTAGVGLLAPVGSNATEAGRALNRRVELVAP
jgi:outer membrane protein OmpA-like peptidoglycan-associated protein